MNSRKTDMDKIVSDADTVLFPLLPCTDWQGRPTPAARCASALSAPLPAASTESVGVCFLEMESPSFSTAQLGCASSEAECNWALLALPRDRLRDPPFAPAKNDEQQWHTVIILCWGRAVSHYSLVINIVLSKGKLQQSWVSSSTVAVTQGFPKQAVLLSYQFMSLRSLPAEM